MSAEMSTGTGTPGIADCHLHIIDPARFPFVPGAGYTPRPDETGTREALDAVLDAHGVAHALLVQPSGYGFDNSAMLDAMAARPGRFKAIAVISGAESDHTLEALAARGVVGVRFNLVNAKADALAGPEAPALLARLKALGWFAQVFAGDDQWQRAAPLLQRSGIRILIDHFGIGDLPLGLRAPGFQTVLALGRSGNAAVKLSAPYRIVTTRGDYGAIDDHAEALLTAFGKEGCVWGSDWPFLGMDYEIRYADCLAVLARWLPDRADRDRVLRDNPARLFGFGR
jgi:predicted TIM-barrel fold metal-dependent hydrolase